MTFNAQCSKYHSGPTGDVENPLRGKSPCLEGIHRTSERCSFKCKEPPSQVLRVSRNGASLQDASQSRSEVFMQDAAARDEAGSESVLAQGCHPLTCAIAIMTADYAPTVGSPHRLLSDEARAGRLEPGLAARATSRRSRSDVASERCVRLAGVRVQCVALPDGAVLRACRSLRWRGPSRCGWGGRGCACLHRGGRGRVRCTPCGRRRRSPPLAPRWRARRW